MYHVVQRDDGTWALEQEDARHAGGRRVLATGSKAAMDHLKTWYGSREKVVFRLDGETREAMARAAAAQRKHLQDVFEEAVREYLFEPTRENETAPLISAEKLSAVQQLHAAHHPVPADDISLLIQELGRLMGENRRLLGQPDQP